VEEGIECPGQSRQYRAIGRAGIARQIVSAMLLA
jgi:hypothetical protein